jgi:streptogramin lyase
MDTERRRRRQVLAIAALACGLVLALPAGALAVSPAVEYQIPTAGSYPASIVAGSDGNMWFSETLTHKIGRITPAGSITEFFLPGTHNAYELALGGDGNIWFTEQANRIGRITPDGTVDEFTTGITAGEQTGGIAAAPDGNMWFTEAKFGGGAGTDKIGRITSTGTVDEYTTGITVGASPNRITAGYDGNLWFTEYGANQIGRISPSTAHVDEYPYTVFSGTAGPAGITQGPDGNVWFTQQGQSRVSRVTTVGTINHFYVGKQPSGIASGPDRNVWVAEQFCCAIGRLGTDGTYTDFTAGITHNYHPDGIAAGPDGNLWFTEYNGNQIGRIDTDVAAPTSGNLLRNPGFELGTPAVTSLSTAPIPGWVTVPSFTAAVYGSPTALPGTALSDQIGGERSFAWGGHMVANVGSSKAIQLVDVAREAVAIDDGRATATLSGLLGGKAAEEDNAKVNALFLSGAGDQLGSAQIGPVSAADRQNVTTLLPRSTDPPVPVPAGTRAIRVVATSTRVNGGATNDGYFDNLSLTLAIAPAPVGAPGGGPGGPGAGGGSGTPADTTAPVIDGFGANPARFAVAAGSTAIAARKRATPRGTTLRYGLSEAAAVTLLFERQVAGRRSGARCVKATRGNRHAKACKLYITVGTLTRNSGSGANAVAFSGRIGQKALALGAYRIGALARDAAGNQGIGRTAAIKVVKR